MWPFRKDKKLKDQIDRLKRALSSRVFLNERDNRQIEVKVIQNKIIEELKATLEP